MSPETLELLLRYSAAGSLALIVVLALRGWLRRRCGAQVAYAAWLLVPATLLAMSLPVPAPLRALAPLAVGLQLTPLQGAATATVASAFDPRPWLLVLWLAGVLLALAWFVRQQRRYLRSLGRLRAHNDARVLQSESTFVGPALVGALRPRIVLPADFEQRYAPSERALILAHERVHLGRGDAWVNALVVALRSLNWFNPLLHYAAGRFQLDQELACDAAVIDRFPEARRRYADAMLKVQLAGQSRQELRLPVGCRWPSDRTLKERILMLKQPRPSRSMRRLGLGLVAGVTLACAWTAWANQPSQPASSSAGASYVAASYRALAPPTYPSAALAQRTVGTMFVRASIDSEGRVSAAVLDHADPAAAAGALGDAAVSAVKSWTFEPARRAGKAVASEALVPVRFALGNDDAAAASPLPSDALDVITVRGDAKH